MDLTRHVRDEIGKQYKVLPTAVLAAAMTPSATRAELKGRIDGVLDTLRSVNANLSVNVRGRGARARHRAAGHAQHHRRRAGTLPRARAQRAPLLRALARAPALAAELVLH